jgi:hypothetical protein
MPGECDFRGPGFVELTLLRDHVELPQDYLEKAQERMEFHKANPVSEHKRGESTFPYYPLGFPC